MTKGNGSQCMTCEIPGRTDSLEHQIHRIERDGVSTSAAIRSLDERMQARFSNVDAGIAEVNRILGRLLETLTEERVRG